MSRYIPSIEEEVNDGFNSLYDVLAEIRDELKKLTKIVQKQNKTNKEEKDIAT